MIEIYKSRRAKLLEGKQSPCMVCIFSGSAPMRSMDEAYPFSVDRNFYYLTGIEKENMILVLRKTYSGDVVESLYIEPYDELLAKWVGPRMKSDEATAISGVQSVRDIGNFDSDLNGIIESSRGLGKFHVYLDLWRYNKDQADTPAHKLAAKLQQRYPAVGIEEINGDMAAMRTIKSEDEIALMRKAQETTRIAIEAMMKHAYPGVNESELEGAFDFALLKQGVRRHAFSSIVAGGPRATTLHYSENNCIVEDGQMVLIDLGSAEKNYCADISRTFPVNGKFSPRQKEIYNTVLEAQRIVIENAKPGVTTRQLNQMVIDYYETRLDDLGLRVDGKTVRDYYYHGVSHHLGLDTHDICTERERILQPGMVITVEPGMYIEAEGIGVRIENDVMITEDGCIDLSCDIPKTVEEIEAIMAK
ncbi:MAG: aminopeptidase P N-terminal domain-containing protein [Clostridia bacterium]|nr:aminopeptidase P N-terminal domain-containing protein [Clostridia bacterium]